MLHKPSAPPAVYLNAPTRSSGWKPAFICIFFCQFYGHLVTICTTFGWKLGFLLYCVKKNHFTVTCEVVFIFPALILLSDALIKATSWRGLLKISVPLNAKYNTHSGSSENNHYEGANNWNVNCLAVIADTDYTNKYQHLTKPNTFDHISDFRLSLIVF